MKKSEFHSYISDENERYACDPHAHMFHLLIFVQSVILLYGMSKLKEGNDGCSNKYMRALAIYLMTVLSSSYGIIMDSEINAPGHGNIFVDGLNAMDTFYLKEQMELISKLASNNTSKVGILPSVLKDATIKISDQRIQIFNNK